jgi:hypothetical protein
MLTKKQLEAISKCAYTICYKCDIQKDCPRMPEAASLAAQTALAYRELAEKRGDMLKRLEWSGQKGNYIADECPVCRNARYQGHKPDCEIAALLKESEDEHDG